VLPRAISGRSFAIALAAFGYLSSPRAHAAPVGAVPAQPADDQAEEDSADSGEDISTSDAHRVLRLQRIEIVGTEQVGSYRVRAWVESEGIEVPGEIFWPEDERIERARDRVRNTGFFRRVNFRVEPVEGSLDEVVLRIELEERPTLNVDQLYLGSSRLTPFRGGFSVAERNFLGRGVQLGGAMLWATRPTIERARRQQAYRVFAEAPRLGKAKLGVLASAWFLSASEPYRVAGAENDPDPDLFRTVDYQRFGGMFGLTFPVLPELVLGVDYRFERVDARLPESPVRITTDSEMVDVDLFLRDDLHRLTTAHFGLVWDGRDEAFLVGKGGRFGLDLQLSSPALGSQYEYIKLVAAGAYSLRLPWRHWLTPKVSGGQIAGRAPRFELFYSGDLSDWTPGREQGLRYSTRNPIDVFGTGIDDRTFGIIFGRFDLEYVWPLFRRTRTRRIYGGDLVFSTGVFTLVEDRATRDMRRAMGQSVAPAGFNADLGVRLDTSIGTLNITVGNVLRRTPL
jgi:outer membrane protein assembly factor BamA